MDICQEKVFCSQILLDNKKIAPYSRLQNYIYNLCKALV